MKAKPTSAPYRATTAKKLSFVASFSFLFSDRNLWKFFLGYFLSYGTFISFASSSNFIIKPYGYTDFEIASNAIFLMLVGIIGSIGFSLYIKKTSNYRLIVRCLAICSSVLMIVLCTWLNTVNNKLITTGILCALGLVLSPLVPICYDLGCEISFPVGQAQVTGLLNGGAFFWAFIASSLVSFIIGYSNKNSSLLAMFILIAFIIVGSCLFVALNIVLKRKNF